MLVDLHGQRLPYAVCTSPASYGGGFLKSAVDLHEIIPILMIGQRGFPIDLRSCKANSIVHNLEVVRGGNLTPLHVEPLKREARRAPGRGFSKPHIMHRRERFGLRR